jgi:glycosyltransferase involved in cell wall biosynthesis
VSLDVLLDGRPLQGPTGSRGVGQYVRHLASGLRRADPGVRVTLLVSRSDPPPRLAEDGVPPPAMLDVGHPPGPEVLWGRWLGPRWIGGSGADVWHATFLAPPRVPAGFPWVATIHDLIPLHHPQAFGRRQRLVFELSLRWASRAPRVVAVSRATADDVVARLGVPASRIEVVPPPVDVASIRAAAGARLDGIDGPYLLHLGGFDPRKGVTDLLLPAFARLARDRPDLSLVMTGGPGRWRDAAERAARAGDLGSRARFVGVLDEDRRARAIAGAAAVVVASRDEGFGLPVVEGLAAGVPVAIGPAPAAREAAGGLAAASEDDTPAGLARAIETALEAGGPSTDAGQGRRLRAAEFAPERIGAQMLAVYRQVLR